MANLPIRIGRASVYVGQLYPIKLVGEGIFASLAALALAAPASRRKKSLALDQQLSPPIRFMQG
jgi:hypothetical protein